MVNFHSVGIDLESRDPNCSSWQGLMVYRDDPFKVVKIQRGNLVTYRFGCKPESQVFRGDETSSVIHELEVLGFSRASCAVRSAGPPEKSPFKFMASCGWHDPDEDVNPIQRVALALMDPVDHEEGIVSWDLYDDAGTPLFVVTPNGLDGLASVRKTVMLEIEGGGRVMVVGYGNRVQ